MNNLPAKVYTLILNELREYRILNNGNGMYVGLLNGGFKIEIKLGLLFSAWVRGEFIKLDSREMHQVLLDRIFGYLCYHIVEIIEVLLQKNGITTVNTYNLVYEHTRTLIAQQEFMSGDIIWEE